MASRFILHQTFVPDSLVFILLFYEVGTDISYWFLRIRHKKRFFNRTELINQTVELRARREPQPQHVDLKV